MSGWSHGQLANANLPAPARTRSQTDSSPEHLLAGAIAASTGVLLIDRACREDAHTGGVAGGSAWAIA
jgi:hypothetical protein